MHVNVFGCPATLLTVAKPVLIQTPPTMGEVDELWHIHTVEYGEDIQKNDMAPYLMTGTKDSNILLSSMCFSKANSKPIKLNQLYYLFTG